MKKTPYYILFVCLLNASALAATNSAQKNPTYSDEYITKMWKKIAEIKNQVAANQPQTASSKPPDAYTLKYTNYNREIKVPPYIKRTSDENCKAIDNRSPLLGKPRNQGSVGWCFAYSAADALTVKTKEKISAADIALANYQAVIKQNGGANDFNNMPDNKIYKSDYSTGFELFAIKATNSLGGLCREIDIPSDDHKEAYLSMAFNSDINSIYRANNLSEANRISNSLNIKNLLNNIESYKRKNGSSFSMGASETPGETALNRKKREEAVLEEKCEILRETKTAFPSLDLEIILGILIGAQNSNDTIDWLQYYSCKNKRIPLPQNFTIYDIEAENNAKHAILKNLDEQLDRGGIAIASYKLELLPLKNDSNTNEKKKNFGTPNHSSTIVGRRFKNGDCQYLIRNSWGTSCDYYQDANTNCDNGNVWVSEDALKTHINYILYFE